MYHLALAVHYRRHGLTCKLLSHVLAHHDRISVTEYEKKGKANVIVHHTEGLDPLHHTWVGNILGKSFRHQNQQKEGICISA